jgi:hypothetical protein
LAQPPDITETFVREVDENLRRDQLRDFFKEHGNAVIGAVILFLVAAGGLIWWQQHRQQQYEQQVEELATVFKDIGSGNLSTAPKQLDELGKSGSKAMRGSARFARAALALQQNDSKTAASIYGSIANDSGLPRPYRDAALIRQTALQFDQLKPDEVISRLQPLTKPGEPWFGSAGEMTALALIKQGKSGEAGKLFATIAKDNSAPTAIRVRAQQIAGTLGVDAGPPIDPQGQQGQQ